MPSFKMPKKQNPKLITFAFNDELSFAVSGYGTAKWIGFPVSRGHEVKRKSIGKRELFKIEQNKA